MSPKYYTRKCQLCDTEYTWKYDSPDKVIGISIPGMVEDTPSHLSYTEVCHRCMTQLGNLIQSYRKSKINYN